MTIYELPGGYSVRTAPSGNKTEFETRNADGETISTIYLCGIDAHNLRNGLMVTALRILA